MPPLIPATPGDIKRAAAMQMAVSIVQPAPILKGTDISAHEERSIRDWMRRVRAVAALIMDEYAKPGG